MHLSTKNVNPKQFYKQICGFLQHLVDCLVDDIQDLKV